MESAQGKIDEPFGRQPQPVTVTIEGSDVRDIEYWVTHLKHCAEFKGDLTMMQYPGNVFRIYPRAVND